MHGTIKKKTKTKTKTNKQANKQISVEGLNYPKGKKANNQSRKKSQVANINTQDTQINLQSL